MLFEDVSGSPQAPSVFLLMPPRVLRFCLCMPSEARRGVGGVGVGAGQNNNRINKNWERKKKGADAPEGEQPFEGTSTFKSGVSWQFSNLFSTIQAKFLFVWLFFFFCLSTNLNCVTNVGMDGSLGRRRRRL